MIVACPPGAGQAAGGTDAGESSGAVRRTGEIRALGDSVRFARPAARTAEALKDWATGPHADDGPTLGAVPYSCRAGRAGNGSLERLASHASAVRTMKHRSS